MFLLSECRELGLLRLGPPERQKDDKEAGVEHRETRMSKRHNTGRRIENAYRQIHGLYQDHIVDPEEILFRRFGNVEHADTVS